MKIIDNMSYALLIEDNAKCMTVGLYKVVGSDLKDLVPHIANFNKATAGKVWVGDPVEWGKIRAQTWRQIVAKQFDKNADYAHCAADGSNMSDDDVLDYWGCRSGENAKTSSKQSKEDFLHLLDELVVKTAVEDDSLSDAEKNAVRLMDEARKAAEAAAAAMEKATEASKVAMAERRATRVTN